MLWLFSCGEVSSVTAPGGLTYKSFVWSDDEKYMIWFSLFVFFWVSAFVIAST